MADPVEHAPMLTVNVLVSTDTWVYRAISKTENTMYIMGEDSLLKARRAAKELLRQGYLVHDPEPRGKVTWIPK